MKNRLSGTTRAFLVLAAGGLFFFQFIRSTHAAYLSGGRDRMNRAAQNQTSGIEHNIVFTTSAVDGTENKVRLTFPDGDDGTWCATVGSDLVVTGITEDSATSLPGTLTAACTQGAGSSSYDTITINGVTDLSTATRYGVKVSDGSTGKLGTPAAANNKVVTVATLTAASAAIDAQNIALSIISNDQVLVSASVDATLTFSLDTNSALLGTLSQSQINKAPVITTVSTSGTNGYTSYAIYANTLRINVSNDINDTSGGTIVAGTEEFGVSTSDSGVDITTWSPASCTTAASTSNASALTTSNQSYADSVSTVTNEQTTLCFLASMSATTTAGSYSTVVTLTTAARF